MKVLIASSEVVPFAKTGGLADVAGSLPIALAELGADEFIDFVVVFAHERPGAFKLRFAVVDVKVRPFRRFALQDKRIEAVEA